jgi:hypothetical protein
MSFCTNCGAKNVDENTFCTSCGNPLNKQTDGNGETLGYVIFESNLNNDPNKMPSNDPNIAQNNASNNAPLASNTTMNATAPIYQEVPTMPVDKVISTALTSDDSSFTPKETVELLQGITYVIVPIILFIDIPILDLIGLIYMVFVCVKTCTVNSYKYINASIYTFVMYLIMAVISTIPLYIWHTVTNAKRWMGLLLLILVISFFITKIYSTINEIIKRKLPLSLSNLFLYSFKAYRKKTR